MKSRLNKKSGNSPASHRRVVSTLRNVPLPGTSTPPVPQQYMPEESVLDSRGQLTSPRLHKNVPDQVRELGNLNASHRHLGSVSSKNSSHPIADEVRLALNSKSGNKVKNKL